MKRSPSALRDKKETRSTNPNRNVTIQVPPKRRKVSSTISPKEAVDLINKSVGFEERQEALAASIKAFEHNVQTMHDDELTVGADSALTKHLALLMSQRGYPKINEDELSLEIFNTCEALELIYRGTTDAVSRSFDRLGSELMRLLILVIDAEVSLLIDRSASEPGSESGDMPQLKAAAGDAESAASSEPTTIRGSLHGGNILRKATKVLGHFARVESATKAMAYFPGLLPNLIRLVCLQPYTVVPAEARMNSLWIIANLACNPENMVSMACHPGLIDLLVSMTFRSLNKDDTVETAVEILRSQSIALRALLNLSWAPENRIPMSENINLVQVLTSLAVMRKSPFGNRGRTVQEIVLQTRRHAVGTLRNLASAPRRNKIHLCEFQNGMLLDVLTDAVLNDSDTIVQEKAFATIHNLAIHDTAPQMVQHPALVLALKDALLEEDTEEETVKKRKASASGTMLVLERSITEEDDCYSNLRELLDAVNPSDDQEQDEEENNK